MILTNRQIADRLATGDIEVWPENHAAQHLRPVGLRVHLGNELLVPEPGQTVDLAAPTADLKYLERDLAREPYLLEPGAFVLASTHERVRTTPRILCTLDGRSTIARLGLTIHTTASVLDGTHDAWLRPVLELANIGNFRVVLRQGIPIGMLCFHLLGESCGPETTHEQYAMQLRTSRPNIVIGAQPLAHLDYHETAQEDSPLL